MQEDQLFDEAAAWIIKIDRGLSECEEKELHVWLDNHPNAIRELIRMARHWDTFDSLSCLSERFPLNPDACRPGKRLNWSHWSIVVALLLAVILGVFLIW